jgi:flagellar hook-associated protein 2
MSRYTKAQTELTDAQAKITTQSDAMSTRLTQQFSTMNSKVAAYKATQTFMTNQIAAWNKSN